MKTVTGLICILFLVAVQSHSQETEIVTTKFPDSQQVSERFYVLKSDVMVKQGEYISFFRASDAEYKQIKKEGLDFDNFIKLKGSYTKGKKNGDWIEYNSSKFIKAEGKYLNDKKKGIWFTYKEQGQVKERFDYDKNLKLQPIINVNSSYPISASENGLEGIVIVSYKINSDCTISNIHIDKGLSSDCDSSAVKFVKKLGELLKKYGFACTDSTEKLELKFTLH